MRKVKCIVCGEMVEMKCGLLVYHSAPIPTRRVCPGSKTTSFITGGTQLEPMLRAEMEEHLRKR